MSPIQIEFMLHCYISPTPTTLPDSPVLQETIELLLEYDMIEPSLCNPNVFVCKPRGVAYVRMLMATPFPVQAYVDPRINNKLNDT